MIVPEITVQQLADRMKSDARFVLLDIRENWELARVSIQDERMIAVPMSQIAQTGLGVLPQISGDEAIYVICHHGIRSANVTAWMLTQNLKQVFSVRGGIHAYAVEIDRSVGAY